MAKHDYTGAIRKVEAMLDRVSPGRKVMVRQEIYPGSGVDFARELRGLGYKVGMGHNLEVSR